MMTSGRADAAAVSVASVIEESRASLPVLRDVAGNRSRAPGQLRHPVAREVLVPAFACRPYEDGRSRKISRDVSIILRPQRSVAECSVD